MLAIDPGPTESAYVLFQNNVPILCDKVSNPDMLLLIMSIGGTVDQICLEMIASYGMPVGAEVFETCVWIGKFMQAAPKGLRIRRLTRIMVKSHICHSPKANDSNIRQALLDRWGGKEKAIGKRKSPGPLYGLSGDMWAALAVAVTAAETDAQYAPPGEGDVK